VVPKDADNLADHGITTFVTEEMERERPTRGTCIPFTVKQQPKDETGVCRDKSEAVRRFIAWTKAHNDLMDRINYVASLPGLQHISNFLLDIHAESATLRDLKLGFWQVEIPVDARSLYRFKDTDGRTFEMNRLPMGLCVSPEIMQTLTSVLAGDPEYCKPEYSLQVPFRRVWVDNIRLAGSTQEMHEAASWMDNVAVELGVTWNSKEALTAVESYEFLGGAWDHCKKTIAAARRHRNSFRESLESTITFRELEQLIGRLVHFSGMLHLVTAKYYWAMKWFRRKANAVANGNLRVEQLLDIPGSVHRNLVLWRNDCRGVYRIPSQPVGKGAATLFTDASLQGWGGILVTPDRAVHATGGMWAKWIKADEESINTLEGFAVAKAIEDFKNTIARPDVGALHVVVDNTSVQAGIKKGRANAERLNSALLEPLLELKALDIPVTVRYIKSGENPADSISRGKEPDWMMALGAHERRGGGRADFVRINPLRVSLSPTPE
jgi:hypothetical protein